MYRVRHKSAPVPRKRRSLIGLRQLPRLLRCAPCQGTYLGCSATPCIHLHLTQRASRDLISASLVPRSNTEAQRTQRKSNPNEVTSESDSMWPLVCVLTQTDTEPESE